ncbi:hypothetical protein [Streptomyces sp. NPDC006879]|uniref:hypothetical protein n=1 Tax=Streptomyces sp. NPDC006879 TaxID=3364767 RepID=UPI00369D07E6
MPQTHRLPRRTASAFAFAALAAAALAAAPAQAADSLPSHQCTLNGVTVEQGASVLGTPADDIILCENDFKNAVLDGRGGNDHIRVKGMIIDAQVRGGDGDDTIQVNNLVPDKDDVQVRGGDGDDTIITGTVWGVGAHGAEVHGDMGDDQITTGSVFGQPGPFQRGGGQVFGNDGADYIVTKRVDFGGRVIGGSENDTIEMTSLGEESSGIVQGGPGADTIRGVGGATLVIGPGYGQVDGNLGKNTCKVRHFSTGDRVRSTLANCDEPAAEPAASENEAVESAPGDTSAHKKP